MDDYGPGRADEGGLARPAQEQSREAGLPRHELHGGDGGRLEGHCDVDAWDGPLRDRADLFMILVIDNYDSFTYNLVHFLGELGATLVVRRNDKISVDEAVAMDPEGIVISPGPCTPDDAGIILPLIKAAGPTIPI